MEWRDVELNNKYEVSTKGTVRIRETKHELSTHVINTGYERVDIHGTGEYKGQLVHRIVAKAFIPNPENKPQVNHKDGDRLNNNVENLEWVTDEENAQHSRDVLGTMDTQAAREVLNKNQKMPVQKVDLETGKVVNEYNSATEASEVGGFSQNKISSVCNGHRKSTGGYGWRFKNEEDLNRKRVRGITLSNGEEEFYFKSRLKASEFLGVNSSTILYHQKKHNYEPFEYRGYLVETEE